MAQELTATLALSSTAGATGTGNNMDIDLSVSDILTVVAPLQGLSAASVSTVGASNIIQPDTSGATYYLYVKHTGTTDGSTATTENLGVELTGDVPFAVLAPDEFCFVPVGGGSFGIQLQSAAGTIQAEYAWFKKG